MTLIQVFVNVERFTFKFELDLGSFSSMLLLVGMFSFNFAALREIKQSSLWRVRLLISRRFINISVVGFCSSYKSEFFSICISLQEQPQIISIIVCLALVV